MTTATKQFRKLRELVALARGLEAEAGRMAGRGRGYWDRVILAKEYRLKAERIAGRLTDDEYWAEMAECADARNAVQ